jgi:hypothetical protein
MQTDTTQLIELLEQQQGLYGRLRVLADRQKVLVIQDDSAPLMALLAERQRLVDELLLLNTRLAPYRDEWTAIYAGLEPPQRRRVASLLEGANTALSSILQSDSRDTGTLTARRRDMTRRLDVIDTGAKASAAYASAGGTRHSSMTDASA